MTAAPVVSYDSVIDGIRVGIRKMKSASLTDQDISESTSIWLTGDPDEASLAFDSLDLLELIVFLEEEFGWSIPEEHLDADRCWTVGDLALLVIESNRENHDAGS